MPERDGVSRSGFSGRFCCSRGTAIRALPGMAGWCIRRGASRCRTSGGSRMHRHERQRATSSRASSASIMKACAVLPVCCAAKAMRTLSSPDSLSFVLPGIVDTPETGDTVAAPTHPRQRERLAVPGTLLRPPFFALLFGRVGGSIPCFGLHAPCETHPDWRTMTSNPMHARTFHANDRDDRRRPVRAGA